MIAFRCAQAQPAQSLSQIKKRGPWEVSRGK
jgi:hypothetical protein